MTDPKQVVEPLLGAPIERRHREAAMLATSGRAKEAWRKHELAWVELNYSIVDQSPVRAAQALADAERRGATAERERVVEYLREQSEYYKMNRNIGPYAAELADFFEQGDHHRRAEEP